MAHRFIAKVKSRAREWLQAPPQEVTSVPSSTSSLRLVRPSSSSTSRPISQPSSFLPISTDNTILSLPGLQERIWNGAYDALKASEPKLVEQYEKILSAKLKDDDPSSAHGEPARNDIGQAPGTRCDQMRKLVQAGLCRTQKQASIKHGIDEGLQVVREFAAIVDKAVSTAPEAAVAWVGICLGLEILSNPITEACENREGIAYVMSRMEWYWDLVFLLLDENKAEQSCAGLRVQLERHVVKLYEKLLSYQMQSVCSYYRHWFAVIARDMVKLDSWADQLNEIKGVEAAVRNDMEQYNTEDSKRRFQELIEASGAMETKLQDIHSAIRGVHSAIETQTQHQEKRHQDDEATKCLKDLRETDPRDDKTRIESTKGGLLRDSYRWILDHQDFQRWREDPQSQLLWIKGDPGKGKTMLLCGIIDELSKQSNSPLSYFFCQDTEARLNNGTGVLRGLIYLLVIHQPSIISHVRKEYDRAGKELFQDENAWEALSKVLAAMLDDPSLDDAVLIVDAIDECRSNRHRLLDLIVKPSRAKWIVSSRNWPDIEEKLGMAKQKVRLHLELNKDSISNAVNVYIRHKVEQLARQKNYDDETRDDIECRLTSNADDTFLWVALVCQELQTTDAWDVPNVIREIPAGLEALYDRMMQYIQGLERRNPEMCRRILSTVVVAYRPLGLAELGLLSDLQTSIHMSRDHISKIASMCGSFLTVKDDTVYVIHQSAKDFLLSSPFIFPSGIKTQHHALFSKSIEALSETLRRDTYGLSDPGFLSDRISIPDPDPLACTAYSCIFWIDHLYEAEFQAKAGEENLHDAEIIHTFLRSKYLYWLESLSLLHSMREGVIAVRKLEALVASREFKKGQALMEFLRDAHRFISSHWRVIQIAPLQAYVSALIFSPAYSLIRQRFENEEPDWVELYPRVGSDWDACLQTLEGHDDYVKSVVFSPDGRHIISGSDDNTVKVWDATEDLCVHTLQGHGDIVRSVASSPDGQRIGSGSHDNTVKIWDIVTGACVQTLKGHDNYVKSVTFSADCMYVASGSSDDTIKIWDTTSGTCLQTLVGHNNWVISVVFSANGQLLASGSDDHTIKIWALATGACIHTVIGHENYVNSVVFSADDQYLASGSSDRTVKIWEVATGKCLQTLVGHGDWVRSVAFSPDGQRIISGSYDNTIKIWDIATGACLQTLVGHGDWVWSVAFSPDGQRIVSGSYDNTIKIWDAAKDIRMQATEVHCDWVRSVAFSSDGQRLVSGSCDNTIKLWDTATGALLRTLEGHSDWVRSVAFSPDRQRIASGSDDDTIKIWDITTGICLRTLMGHIDNITSAVFSPDGRGLASGSCDNTIKVWDVATGALLQTLEGHSDQVWSVAFSPDGQRIISGSRDNTVKIWVIAAGACLQTLIGHDNRVTSVTFSPNSQRIVSSSDDNTIKIWDAATDACVDTLLIGKELCFMSFDRTENSLLHTDIGVLRLNHLPLLPAADSQPHRTTLQHAEHLGWGISADGEWIIKDGKRMLCLPRDYRATASAVMKSTVAIGCGSGCLLVMRFS